MRDNGKVTGVEVPVENGEELVSATDTKGRITFANNTFCRIADYTQDQLLRKAHNIVRHSDMPEAAFQQLWDCLKAGKPWMGIVKNRCQNGDHYWVDAYVTPLKAEGVVTGYESVRVQADRSAIDRAEAVYKRIRQGKPAFPVIQVWWNKIANSLLNSAFILVLILINIAIFSNLTAESIFTAIAFSLLAGFFSVRYLNRSMNMALKLAQQEINDPLAAYIYTGRIDAVGNIELAQIAQRARLRTALGRMVEASKEVKLRSEMAREQVQRSHEDMNKQQQETVHVADSMQQMAQAVQEVAASAADTSGATSRALQQVGQGSQVLDQASDALQSLSKTVLDLGSVVEHLSADSVEIASVVDVIRGIAEQTNLLALNAAIEAARAGEQGRGFAVVADEVRTLASRTRESTQHIQNIIETLGKATSDAAANMDECRLRADKCVDEMSHVKNALNEITDSVSTIDQMSERIAVSSEQQSVVAMEIERNVQSISEISVRTQSEVASADQLSEEMVQYSNDQLQLVERFD